MGFLLYNFVPVTLSNNKCLSLATVFYKKISSAHWLDNSMWSYDKTTIRAIEWYEMILCKIWIAEKVIKSPANTKIDVWIKFRNELISSSAGCYVEGCTVFCNMQFTEKHLAARE